MTWKKKRPGGGAGVDGVSEALELNSLLLEVANEIDKGA